MAVLTNTKLETHPATTASKNSVINANWQQLENIFNPALATSNPVYALLLKALVKNASPTLTDGFMLVYSTAQSRLNLQAVDVGNALKIQGRNISATAPADGQSLVWNAGTSLWEPANAEGNATFLQGIAIDPTAPTEGQGLIYDSALEVWKAGSAAADATALQGRAIATTAPENLQALVWDDTNSLWTPGNVAAGGGGGSGSVAAAGVLQIQVAEYASYASLGTIPWDDTIPQSTEGTEFLSKVFTPKRLDSKILIRVTVPWTSSTVAGVVWIAALFKDSGVDALAAAGTRFNGTSEANPICFTYIEDPATITARTYKVRGGTNNGSAYINGAGSRSFGGVMKATLEIIEFMPVGSVINAPPWLNDHPDNRPQTPNALDDEFDDPATLPGGGSAKWTWANQGTATIAMRNSAAVMVAPAVGADNWRYVTQAAPATTWRVTIKLWVDGEPTANIGAGLVAADGTGKFHAIYCGTNDHSVRIVRWTDATTYSSTDATIAFAQQVQYLRLTDNGTNLLFECSHDGIAFALVATIGRTAHLASGPTLIGIGCQQNSAKDVAGVWEHFRIDDGTDAAKEDLLIAARPSKTYCVWTALQGQPPAANYATPNTRNSIGVLCFDSSTEESVVFVGVMPEGSAPVQGVSVIISWVADTATSGAVVWAVAFERCGASDLDADSFDTENVGAATTTNATSGNLNTTVIQCSTIDSIAPLDMFRLKVLRKAASGSDTMNSNDAQLISVELRGL